MGKNMVFAGILRIMFLALMIIPLDSFAEAGPEAKQAQRPKIGVVFGGGGAKGAAHIGVLKCWRSRRSPSIT